VNTKEAGKRSQSFLSLIKDQPLAVKFDLVNLDLLEKLGNLVRLRLCWHFWCRVRFDSLPQLGNVVIAALFLFFEDPSALPAHSEDVKGKKIVGLRAEHLNPLLGGRVFSKIFFNLRILSCNTVE
jgi:hypothetical protein